MRPAEAFDTVSDILRGYGLGNAQLAKTLRTDRAWLTIHPSGKYVVTKKPLYDPASRRVERLEAASSLMAKLHRAGEPWADAIPRSDGRYLTVVGSECYQVTSYVRGRPLSNGVTDKEVDQVARCLGRFHRFQEQQSTPNSARFDFGMMTLSGLDQRRAEWKRYGVDDSDLWRTMCEARSDYDVRWGRLQELPFGWIHMDLSPGNVHFEGDRLAGVFDFEGFPGQFVLDLAFAFLFWAFRFDPEVQSGRLERTSARVLLRSYSEERPLQRIESERFKDAVVWASIRWWSRQASHRPDDPAFRLTSRCKTYHTCREIDRKWLTSLIEAID